MSGLSNLWAKLSRSKKYREAFVASQLKRGIPTQLRVLLKQRGWSQAELAERSGLTQGAISRASDPDYGNLTFNNVLKIAAGFDIAFVGKFVPFSELSGWHDSITDESKLLVPGFEDDSTVRKPAQSEHAEMISVLAPYGMTCGPDASLTLQQYITVISESTGHQVVDLQDDTETVFTEFAKIQAKGSVVPIDMYRQSQRPPMEKEFYGQRKEA